MFGIPKVLREGLNLNFEFLGEGRGKLIGAFATQIFRVIEGNQMQKSSEISDMGRLKIFLVKKPGLITPPTKNLP